jgi:hypothetical protein
VVTESTVYGPYETKGEAAAEPLVRDTYLVARAGGDMDAENERRLVGACQDAGVRLGAYDRRVLAWLAGWEPELVQVVVGLLSRAAHGGGCGGG